MTRNEIKAKVADLLGDITDQDGLVLTDDTVASDVDEWDSMNHVKLILALESELNIRFEADEVSAPESVGSLVDLIASKLQ